MSSTTATRSTLTQLPKDLVSVADYERLAPEFIDAATLAYIAGGSGIESTLHANRAAFEQVRIYNRLLTDCSSGTTDLTLFGQAFRHPILLAPVAYHKLVHPDGELATAQAAQALEAGMVVSTLASCTLESIAAELGASSNKWFQLYCQPNIANTLDLVRRAEAAGYQAIVVTLDTPIQPVSRRVAHAGFSLPADIGAINLHTYEKPAPRALTPQQSIIFQGMMAEAPTWKTLSALLNETSLPVIVKGVSHPGDAVKLLELGVAGLVVSNHGGRALDCTPASLHLLPEIRRAAGQQVPVLLDGGIRSGYDVFKALALGANAVLIGRPQLYALAVAGALGVAHMLKLMRDELEICMALAGCPTLDSIHTESVLFPSSLTGG